MDKDQYDRPEDENSVWSRGVGLLIGAIAIIAIFYAIYNTDVLR